MAIFLQPRQFVTFALLLPLISVALYKSLGKGWPALNEVRLARLHNWASGVQHVIMAPSKRTTYFKTVQQLQADYAPAKISQYRSERTGMHVVVVDRKGPKVQGYFALATEIFDDSGAPHTLEHLVFMGSKSYRYKGVLDKLATRAYSNTNAWTATDHTAYTLDTAGWEGFAQILPVYLEHVILPTLTDEACYTEVWHVDGEGHDAGVVYSEMQGVQNTGGELMDLEARRLLYPPEFGFRYETGGKMENLRQLSAKRIREFHKVMYQPKNLCLVLVGEVDHDNMLEILDEFEAGILDEIPRPDAPFTRPWIESKQPPALTQSVVKTVEFPEEDEVAGDVLVAYFGPNCNDALQIAALSVLLTYLSGSSVSILENKMVEQEQLASAINTWWDARPRTVIWFQPTSVVTEKLASVQERLLELLKEVAAEPLDMSYMKSCIQRERRQLKHNAESSGDFFATNAINDFLFGNRDGSTLKDVATIKQYDTLENWTDNDWRSYLQKWISDANHISILGRPSIALSNKLKGDEVARVAAQREKLGPEGLARLAKKLEEVKSFNDAPIPAEFLQKWPVPGVDSIHFIKSITGRSGLARGLGVSKSDVQKSIDEDKELPMFIQFESVPTNFVEITIHLGTSGIPVQYRPLLPLFIDNFFNTPVIHNGKRVEFEDIVTELEEDTISYDMRGSGRLGDSEGMMIQFQVEPDKYAKTIQWLRALMFDSIFDEARLQAGLTKILADIPEAKRSGDTMAYAADAMIHLAPESVAKARCTLVKATYLKRIKKLLQANPKSVISMLELLRTSLFTFNNMRVLVVANITALPHPVSTWSSLLSGLNTSAPLLPIEKQLSRLSPAGKKPGGIGALIVPMPTIDSSFLVASTLGPHSYNDPSIPSLAVAISYLDAVEGPLWSAVRGTGLAYGTGFSRDIESGHMSFRVDRSPDAFKAFAAAKSIIEAYIDGTKEFEAHALEGAISSIVVAIADEQPTMASASINSFVNSVVRGVGENFNEELMRKVREVDVEQIKSVMKGTLLKAFLPGEANLVVTCAPVLEETLKNSFAAAGFKTEVKALSDFKEDYGLQGEEVEGEDGSEDEEQYDGEEGEEDDDDEEEQR